ncbi:MAG: hypothetical protein H7062_15250, partial [Candidatus Saccharimonas sp.]|nr:hypothetical protein [Planctomycetaceae bacterium]
MLGRVSYQTSFVRSLFCGAWLAMAGTSISAVVAQDAEPDSEFNFNGQSEVDVTSFDGFVEDGSAGDGKTMDDSSVPPDDGGANEIDGEFTTTEFVADPDLADDSGLTIEPNYRDATLPDEPCPVFDPLFFGDGDLDAIFLTFGDGFGLSSLGTSAQTPNQIAIAAQLDALSGSTTPEIQAIIDQVALLTPEAQRAALDSLSGETYETLSSIGLQIGEQSLRTVRNRLVNNLSFLSGGGGVMLGQRSSPRTALGGD